MTGNRHGCKPSTSARPGLCFSGIYPSCVCSRRATMGLSMIRVWLVAALGASLPVHAAPVSDVFAVLATADVEVRLNHTVTLPCSFSPPQTTDSLEVRWYRGIKFDDPVLLYQSKKLVQTPYSDRASFGKKHENSAGLTGGDVSLQLTNAMLEDAGDYTCYVSSDQDYDSQIAKLIVVERGSPVLMSYKHTEDKKVNVSCKSDGWYPHPSLRWSHQNQDPKPNSLQYSNDSSGLLSVHSWILVSGSSPMVSCIVGPPGKSQEARLSVNPPDLQPPPPPVALVAFALLLAVVLAALGLWYYKNPRGPKSAISDCFGGHIPRKDEPDGVETRRLLCQDTIKPIYLSRAQQCYANVKLDGPANQYVKIRDRVLRDAGVTFPDGEKVTCLTAVRGTPGFSSGQHYWEVCLHRENIGIKNSWWLGVTSAAAIPQEPNFTSTSSNGFWFLSSSADRFQLSAEPRVEMPVSSRPQTVGVYLDRDGGELSFYDVERQSLIGSLMGAFQGEVFPLFNPGKGDKTPMEIVHRQMGQEDGVASGQDGAAKD